jgi:hypothetical protein
VERVPASRRLKTPWRVGGDAAGQAGGHNFDDVAVPKHGRYVEGAPGLERR